MPELQLPDPFEWVRYPWGQALRCRAMTAVADHCFTTRQPALAHGPLAPGDGWHRVALSMGVSPRAIVRLHQVHGTGLVTIRRGDDLPPESAGWGTADIAVSDRPDVALSVRVADCVPILMADPRTGAVAAIHAGWRGIAAGAAQVGVAALTSGFGARPQDLLAAIGPSIGPCCYRVGADVRDAFSASGRWDGLLDAWFSPQPTAVALRGVPGRDPVDDAGRSTAFLDTWEANADQLRRAGVPAAQVHASRVCTSCHRNLFHSYRVDGERAGRMIGVILAAKR
jgi:YfiH family protein